MSRPTLIENLRGHFDKQDIFPDLEKIVADSVTAKRPLNTGRAIKAIHTAVNGRKKTGLIVINAPNVKAMIRRSRSPRILAASILGQLVRIRRGPEEGTVNNPAGRPVGSKNAAPAPA